MVIKFEPDKQSQKPIYRQLADHIISDIKSGLLRKGRRLPSVREFCSALGLSSNTVTHALDLLRAEGYIHIEPKKRATVTNTERLLNGGFSWDYFMESGKQHQRNSSVYSDRSLIRSKSDIINIYEMRIGEEYTPYIPVREALSRVLEGSERIFHNSFLNVRGTPLAREMVRAQLRKYDIYVDPSEVLVTSGIINGLSIITRGLIRQNMDIFIPSPDMSGITNMVAGFNIINLPQDRFGVIPEEFEGRIRRKSGVLLVSAAGNWPNMASMTKERVMEILNICSRNNIIIVENDVMREYWLDVPHNVTFKSLDYTGNVLYIFSLTRPLLPGLRVAAVAGNEKIINILADIKLLGDWGTDIISQLTLGELIKNNIFACYMNLMRPEFVKRRDLADSILRRYIGDIAEWDKPEVGLSFWVRFNEAVDTRKFHAESHGVLVYPGTVHGKKFKNCLWLCFTSVPAEQFQRAVNVISFLARKQL